MGNMARLSTCLAAGLLVSTSVARAAPITWAYRGEIISPTPRPVDLFGTSLALNDGHALVGFANAEAFAADQGGWSAVSLPFDVGTEQVSAVALRSGVAAIATDMGGTAFSVSVLRWEGSAWVGDGTFQLPEASCCPSSMVVDSETLVVGHARARDDNLTSGYSGAAYVYHKTASGWVAGATLSQIDTVSVDGFGASVAMVGDVLAVGAPLQDDTGVVHLFTRQGTDWDLVQQLMPDGSNDSFGAAVAFDGSTLAVASRTQVGARVSFYSQGTSGWEPGANIDMNVGASVYSFPVSMALKEDALLVGVPYMQFSDASPGLAYVYERDDLSGWTLVRELSAPHPQPGASFGAAVALDRGVALVGAPLDSRHAHGAGAVFVFERGEVQTTGEACIAGDFCDTGACVDGFCCNEPCDGACEGCSHFAKGSGEDGICGAASAGTDPHDDCLVDPDLICGADGLCDGQSQCRSQAPTNTACGMTSCSDGVVSGSLCDGWGSCVEAALASCFPYLCSASRCMSECSTDSDCAAGSSCSAAGTCVSSAVCDGESTIHTPDGRAVDCAPYRCLETGACANTCNDVADCLAPFVCNRVHACIPPPQVRSQSGCGCRMGGAGTQGGWLALLAAGIAVGRRRRRSGRGTGIAVDGMQHRQGVRRLCRAHLAGGVFALCALGTNAARADTLTAGWVEVGELGLEGAEPGRLFGQAVSMDGTTLAVGAPGASTVQGSGRVAIYELSGGKWESLQVLAASDTESGFGSRIAVRADWLAVGAPGITTTDPGTVSVYQRGPQGWSLTTVLGPGLAAGGDRFGSAVDVGPDGTVYVGSPRSDERSMDGGAVYIFAAGSATPTKLLPPVGSPTLYDFGKALGISDNDLLVGAPGDNTRGVHAGAVHAFHWDGDSLGARPTIVPSKQGDLQGFGEVLSVDGVNAVIGPEVVVLEKGTDWLAVQDVVFSAAAVAVEDDWMLLGDADGVTALRRTASQWGDPIPLRSQTASTYASKFGNALSLSLPYAVIGAPSALVAGRFSGAAYVFAVGDVVAQGAPCLADSLCDTGFCVDGFCCDAICDGDCQACSRALKGSGDDGACGPVAVGTDPHDDCEPDSGFPVSCGADGLCGAGGCRRDALLGTPCGMTSCAEATVRGRLCDGKGRCLDETVVSCMPYRCDGSVCAQTCDIDADCLAGAHCSLAHTCISAAYCDGHTVRFPDGSEVSCAPYICQPNGACLASCNGPQDCVAPYVCNRGHRCVDFSAAPEEESGNCGCRTAGGPGGADSLSWLCLAAVFAALRRGRLATPTRP